MVSPIVIAGPTASGKSAYALKLAKELDGEIICADSRQIYAGMRIGSAAPSDDELQQVPHHGYGVVDPNSGYDAGQFVADTDQYVNEILSRAKTPILVGGTGLYLRAWRFGLIDVPAKSESLRAKLIEQSSEALYDQLERTDPNSAELISSQDRVRIIRALEIFLTTGRRASELRTGHEGEPRMEADYRLILPDKEWLWPRIESRVRDMFNSGLVEEASALRANSQNHLLKTMGYEEALMFVDGLMSLTQAIERAFIHHRQYAKRQMTWFKKENWWTRINFSSI